MEAESFMGYRDTYFRNAPSYMGKYQCCSCGGWFNKCDIDVDHRIPKKHGGTDDLSNLQAMCQHCNRSKNDSVCISDYLNTGIRSAVSGNLGDLTKSIITQEFKNALGIKYKRR